MLNQISMQTILGAGGAIGTPLAADLMRYTNQVRLVGRNPKRVNPTDELFPADLTNREQVLAAVAGSEVVYLVAGLEYKFSVWQRDWPRIMTNVIEACLAHQSKLVFFDNIYMYALDTIPHMTEQSKIDPPSRKGQVRAAIAKQLMDAVAQRGLQALIARSADFYGPKVKSSMLDAMIISNFQKGKKAMWAMDAGKLHAFTYTPDAARATAELGNTPDAYGRVWHLPTSQEKWTGKDFITRIATGMKQSAKFSILSRGLCTILGIFIPILREMKEMLYQYDRDYGFDSSDYEKRFGWKATPYETGLQATIEAAKA